LDHFVKFKLQTGGHGRDHKAGNMSLSVFRKRLKMFLFN